LGEIELFLLRGPLPGPRKIAIFQVFLGTHFHDSAMLKIDFPPRKTHMQPLFCDLTRFGALFKNSKKNLKRGFLAMTKKINFSTLRSENFAKIASPIDSPPKITYILDK
jgi:hypothetical protein